MSPKSALPHHLRDFDWKNTDNASFIMRCKKRIQTWLAAGPRVSETTFPQRLFKWREIPKQLFKIKGEGPWRFENTNGSDVRGSTYFNPDPGYFISRIQPWIRYHISLQWPLFFNCHFIYCQKNVVKFPTYQSAFGITKMFTFGIGAKRDADKVFWLTMNMGGNFE